MKRAEWHQEIIDTLPRPETAVEEVLVRDWDLIGPTEWAEHLQ